MLPPPKHQAGDNGADDADDNVENDALLSVSAHDHAGEPAQDTTDDEPNDEYPLRSSCSWPPVRRAAPSGIKTRDAGCCSG